MGAFMCWFLCVCESVWLFMLAILSWLDAGEEPLFVNSYGPYLNQRTVCDPPFRRARACSMARAKRFVRKVNSPRFFVLRRHQTRVLLLM